MIFYTGDAAADLKWVLVVPAGATLVGVGRGLTAAATSVSSAQGISTITGTPSGNVYVFGIPVSATDSCGLIDFTVYVGTTGGTVGLSWAQGTSSATGTTVKALSELTAVLT